ncbi:MAG: hypothetical protein PHT72_00810 [Candidatus Absconditabacteria bacterium]|nr:hypothetical protein [Candidatus Absconditabacteria bacterium]
MQIVKSRGSQLHLGAKQFFIQAPGWGRVVMLSEALRPAQSCGEESRNRLLHMHWILHYIQDDFCGLLCTSHEHEPYSLPEFISLFWSINLGHIQNLEYLYLLLMNDIIERISSPQYLGIAKIKSLSEYFEKIHRSYMSYKSGITGATIKTEYIVLPRIVF